MRRCICALTCAVALGAVWSPACAEQDNAFLRLQIALQHPVYHRGQADPVKDLIVTLTATNTSDVIHAHFPRPELGPEDRVRFEIYKKGVATGEKVQGVVGEAAAAATTRVVRSPAPQPTGRGFHNDVSLKPGQSKSFTMNPGQFYNMRDAGRYEMTAIFQGVRSNTVSFEVAPIKRVDVRRERLLRDIKTYERGQPGFAYMFYISPTARRWDEVFFLHRMGKGAEINYERHNLCFIKAGSTPQVATAGQKVGLLCQDKAEPGVHFLYTLDFNRSPIAVTRTRHQAASGPLTLAPSGDGFEVR